MDLVFVKNTGTKPLRLAHDALGDVILRPDEQKILTLEYVNVHFGNPSARDVGKDKARTDTYNKVRVNWGFYAGMEPDELWEERRPRFEVHALGENGQPGERVWTVLEDPEGVKSGPTLDDRALDDPRFVNAKIVELSAQIERLTALVNQQQSRTVEGISAQQVAQHMERITDTKDVSADIADELDTGILPSAPADERPVTKDAPRTPRTGPPPRGGRS